MDKNSRHDHDEDEGGGGFAALPIGPDGGIDAELAAGMIGQPAAVPDRTPEHFICMRGPCKHYWHLVTMAQEGNPSSTWEHLGIAAPRQHHHTCTVNPGFETDFGDDNAFKCNRWDPLIDTELVQIKTRRELYYAAHPEHRPKEEDHDDQDA